jgi:FkbM family methyltransferase
LKGDIDTIEAHGKRYTIANPGGRIGSKIAGGVPYEAKLLNRIHGLGLSGTAFDIGAHIGNHSLFLARMCGLSVHAFEAHPQAFDALVANVKRNRLGGKITCHQVAAGDRATTAQFREAMTLKLDRGDVPVARIDDMIDVPGLALVKVDVEGMEPHALRGMSRHLERSHPLVFAEVHTPAAHGLLADVLEPHGYEHTATVRMGSNMEEWSWRP